MDVSRSKIGGTPDDRKASRGYGRAMVRFENVGMRYGSRPAVLRDVTFGLEGGSFPVLPGLSGAGKTPLLKLFYLADPPSRGLVTLFGQELATARRRD